MPGNVHIFLVEEAARKKTRRKLKKYHRRHHRGKICIRKHFVLKWLMASQTASWQKSVGTFKLLLQRQQKIAHTSFYPTLRKIELTILSIFFSWLQCSQGTSIIYESSSSYFDGSSGQHQ